MSLSIDYGCYEDQLYGLGVSLDVVCSNLDLIDIYGRTDVIEVQPWRNPSDGKRLSKRGGVSVCPRF